MKKVMTLFAVACLAMNFAGCSGGSSEQHSAETNPVTAPPPKEERVNRPPDPSTPPFGARSAQAVGEQSGGGQQGN